MACLLALAGCSSLAGTGDAGYVTGDGTISQLAPDERGGAVELTGTGLDGERIDIADYRGLPVVVVVWGSWCPPCRAEAPDVVAAATQLGNRAHFLGINIRDASTAQATSFVRRWQVPYPSVFSPDGQALLPFSGTLSPNSVPSFVVLDEQGRVAASLIGPLPSTTTLVEMVQDVTQQTTPSSGTDSDG